MAHLNNSSADFRLSTLMTSVDNPDPFHIRNRLTRSQLLQLWLYTAISVTLKSPITSLGQCIIVFLLAAVIQFVDDNFPNPIGTIPATMTLGFYTLLTNVSTRSLTADTIIIVSIILSVYFAEQAYETYMNPWERW